MKYLGQEQQWLKAPTEGATKEGLQFEVGPWAGEAIEDGVAFSLPGKLEGAFIVSFSDFEELYKLARQARGLGQEHDRQKIIVQPVMTIDVGEIAEIVGTHVVRAVLASQILQRGMGEGDA